MQATYLTMLADVPMADRFIRALALSAYLRELAWQGAVLHAGQQGDTAVVDRFLLQLYGAGVARQFRAAREQGVNDE